MLAMKLAEVNWIKNRTGEWPVLLLDEILAELDIQRRTDLQSFLSDYEQTLLTTTDLNLFDPAFINQSTVWQVEQGFVSSHTTTHHFWHQRSQRRCGVFDRAYFAI